MGKIASVGERKRDTGNVFYYQYSFNIADKLEDLTFSDMEKELKLQIVDDIMNDFESALKEIIFRNNK